MVRGTASNEHNASGATHDGEVATQTTEGDLVVLKVDTATHGVDNRLRLLVDLLLHKVIERALHDFGQFDLQGLDRAEGRVTVLTAQAVHVEL